MLTETEKRKVKRPAWQRYSCSLSRSVSRQVRIGGYRQKPSLTHRDEVIINGRRIGHAQLNQSVIRQ